MAEKLEMYVDGIGKIHFTGGMVRYDMVTLEPNESGKENLHLRKKLGLLCRRMVFLQHLTLCRG